MTDETRPERLPAEWPTPEPGQVRVLVVGTYHMANPGSDVVTVEADDVLAPDRQEQLRELTGRLADWEPDRVAVEAPHAFQQRLDSLYEAYRAGTRRYDEAGEFPAPFPDSFGRNEVVQVGFRLAERLDHDRVLAVDHEPRVPGWTSEEAMAAAMADPPPGDVAYDVPDPETMQARAARRLAESTVLEYLREENREPRLRENHALMFASGLEHGDPDAAVGMLSAWYERNLRTVRTLRDGLAAGDEKCLLLFGSGHVRVLRHLLGEAPMFCPVSPLPHLR